MRSDWTLLGALALGASAVLLARKAGPSRVSFVPLMRVGEAHGRQLERLGAEALPLDAEEERRLGAEIAARMEEPESSRQLWLKELGRRLEATGLVKRYAGRYEYRLISSPEPDAFALPGGYIFVSE